MGVVPVSFQLLFPASPRSSPLVGQIKEVWIVDRPIFSVFPDIFRHPRGLILSLYVYCYLSLSPLMGCAGLGLG